MSEVGETSKRWKKTEVSRLLREAGDLLRQAGAKLIRAAEAQEKLGQAAARLRQAEKLAQPTVHAPIPEAQYEGKTKRDGLPAAVRQAIIREAAHAEKLLARVKALPVSQDERLLAKREKAKQKGILL